MDPFYLLNLLQLKKQLHPMFQDVFHSTPPYS